MLAMTYQQDWLFITHANYYPLTIVYCLCFLLSGCGLSDLTSASSAKPTQQSNATQDEPPRLVAPIQLPSSDFIDANGQQTSLSQQIADCSFLNNRSQACDLAQLHFIGKQNSSPELANIMQRLIVSDRWMAQRFAAMLERLPGSAQADMFRLFASVTAIIIHRDINPAFFWPATGAIYLNPYVFWQTPEEFASLGRGSDPRAAFSNNVNYLTLSRYFKGSDPAWANNQRSDDNIMHALSALLFHELAHASDQFPLAAIQQASLSASPLSLQAQIHSTSSKLDQQYPLLSETLKQLAGVLFAGQAVSFELNQLSAAEVADIFETDGSGSNNGASDDYAYLQYENGLHYEDTAMLFEEVMMKIHFNIDREIAFATPLTSFPQNCQDLQIDWARANRILDSNVLPRARFVVNQLLPEHSHQLFFDAPPLASEQKICQSDSSSKQAGPENSLLATKIHRHAHIN